MTTSMSCGSALGVGEHPLSQLHGILVEWPSLYTVRIQIYTKRSLSVRCGITIIFLKKMQQEIKCNISNNLFIIILKKIEVPHKNCGAWQRVLRPQQAMKNCKIVNSVILVQISDYHSVGPSLFFKRLYHDVYTKQMVESRSPYGNVADSSPQGKSRNVGSASGDPGSTRRACPTSFTVLWSSLAMASTFCGVNNWQ